MISVASTSRLFVRTVPTRAVTRTFACLLLAGAGPVLAVSPGESDATLTGEVSSASGALQAPGPRAYNLIELFSQQSFMALIADLHPPATASAAPGFRQQVRAAVLAHPSLKAGADRWTEAEGARAEMRGGLFPQIYAGVGGESTLVERPGRDVPSDMNTNLYVRVTQLLFDAGALFRKIEAAEMRVEAQRFGLRVTAQSLALKALTAYYDVVRHTRRVALAEANLQRHRVLLEMIGEAVAGSVSSRSDLLRAQSREADARATLAGAHGDLERAQAVWREYFGEAAAPRQLPPLRPSIPATAAEAHERLLAGSLELARLEQLAQAAAREFEAEKANLLPQVSVQLTGRQFQLDQLRENDNEVVASVQLSYPLYTGGSQTARRSQAASRAGAARSDVDTLRSELLREVSAALADVASQTQRLKALELAMQAEEATILAYLEQFTIGRRSLADLLDAQRDLFGAAFGLVDGTASVELAHYAVSAALGESLGFFDLNAVGAERVLPRIDDAVGQAFE